MEIQPSIFVKIPNTAAGSSKNFHDPRVVNNFSIIRERDRDKN